MKSVLFTAIYEKWRPGDIAGFEDQVARKLVSLQVASPHGEGWEEKKVSESKQVKPEKEPVKTKQAKPVADKQMRPGKRPGRVRLKDD